MKNVKILKRVVPLLRENEEIVSVPEKNKKRFFSFVFLIAFSLFFCFLLLLLTITTIPLSESLIPCVFSLIFLLIFCFLLIPILNKFIVITNQRLFCLSFTKVVAIERDDIETVTYDYRQNGLARLATVIETKDSKSYKFELYDYIKIREELFCNL